MTIPPTAAADNLENSHQSENDTPADNFFRQQREDFEDELEHAHKRAVENEKKRRRIILIVQLLGCISAVGFSFLLLYADLKKVAIATLVFENQQTILALMILFVATLSAAAITGSASRSFQDVDIRQRLGLKKRVMPATVWPFPTSERSLNHIYTDYDEEENSSNQFYNHFIGITRELEERASNAEEKASLLLDKGTTYTIAGIVFFIISIITWQTVSWIKGFQTEFIYGIVSCATLFIFIEFLSAWFLRQYRHFVDTATYLLKVKSIFDRFALVYFASDDISNELTEAKTEAIKTLLRMLEEQIKWPDSYLLKKPDTNFASEAVQAMTSLTKELRKSQKRTSQREATENKPN